MLCHRCHTVSDRTVCSNCVHTKLSSLKMRRSTETERTIETKKELESRLLNVAGPYAAKVTRHTLTIDACRKRTAVIKEQNSRLIRAIFLLREKTELMANWGEELGTDPPSNEEPADKEHPVISTAQVHLLLKSGQFLRRKFVERCLTALHIDQWAEAVECTPGDDADSNDLYTQAGYSEGRMMAAFSIISTVTRALSSVFPTPAAPPARMLSLDQSTRLIALRYHAAILHRVGVLIAPAHAIVEPSTSPVVELHRLTYLMLEQSRPGSGASRATCTPDPGPVGHVAGMVESLVLHVFGRDVVTGGAERYRVIYETTRSGQQGLLGAVIDEWFIDET
ncbi:hypothetical protein J8273_8080 [Carpediemonas membranifera]|uniref:Uncharacterized protein n=1 Tax=Carpediemonas membranifera TaxID=201153 RepID=A0A8J6APV1_9EUKA|nr:hypothetical protein J8273_8080 [Carpediemonas membranifera]|eukprot:KAG9390043.1 hypothetical protein J8273_8080 [Carpediemonas membranifera]